MTMEHAEVSELLGPLMTGGLDAARRNDVEAHLATCDECRGELRALEALVALEAAELTPGERATLRTGIASAARFRPAWARFMPALAAAAVIALAIVGYNTLSLRGDDSKLPPASREADADADAEEEAAGLDAADDSVENATQATIEDGTAGGAAGSAGAADTLDAAAPAPAKGKSFSIQARRAPARFATTALEPALLDLGDRDLNFYARTVPGPWRAQLDACTRRLFASQPVTLTLAFAAAYPRDDLLVAGYTWSEATSGAPTHFAFWGWWRGDCDTVSPVFVRGTL